MGKGKGAFKNDMKKIFGTGPFVAPNNFNIQKKTTEEKAKKVVDETNHQISDTYKMNSHYDLDFESNLFGHIFLKELRNKSSGKSIQLFFEDLENIEDVVVTVHDTDDARCEKMIDHIMITRDDVEDPRIDEKTFLILEFPNYTRKISARFFWALLPKHITAPYVKKYYDHYQRLSEMLYDFKKWVVLDDFD